MTLSIHHSGPHANIGIDLGELRCVRPHVGLDRVEYLDIQYAHGKLSMDMETWRVMIVRSQEAIVAAQSKRPIRNGVNLGGACYEGGAE